MASESSAHAGAPREAARFRPFVLGLGEGGSIRARYENSIEGLTPGDSHLQLERRYDKVDHGTGGVAEPPAPVDSTGAARKRRALPARGRALATSTEGDSRTARARRAAANTGAALDQAGCSISFPIDYLQEAFGNTSLAMCISTP